MKDMEIRLHHFITDGNDYLLDFFAKRSKVARDQMMLKKSGGAALWSNIREPPAAAARLFYTHFHNIVPVSYYLYCKPI